MSALEREGGTLGDRFVHATNNVLLLAPSFDGCADDACVDLLSVDPPGGENVLFVTFVQSPDERLLRWRSRRDAAAPARIGFVDAGDSTRSAAVTSTGTGGPADTVSVRTVSNAGDLTHLGIQLSTYLSEWEDDPNRTVVCFHSLSTLLQYADLERIFRFLHAITGRIRSADAVAHYHMDPSAHDAKTLNTLTTLFDGIVEWDGEDWVVRNR